MADTDCWVVRILPNGREPPAGSEEAFLRNAFPSEAEANAYVNLLRSVPTTDRHQVIQTTTTNSNASVWAPPPTYTKSDKGGVKKK